jgi:hypothetical protein
MKYAYCALADQTSTIIPEAHIPRENCLGKIRQLYY